MITPGNGSPGAVPDGNYHADLPIGDKVCLITGGGQPRGRAVAEALARAGAKTVAITYSDDRAPAHEIYLDIQSLGAGCLLAHMDVTDRSSVRNVLVWITDQVGKIDILVNAEEAAWPERIDFSIRCREVAGGRCEHPGPGAYSGRSHAIHGHPADGRAGGLHSGG
ncbi:MAG: SDR family NAD(P)-dependent oxidoreductase [Chloroflexi bacterium]|nr:SDR family NAD(P)-dependent oxidoreductase [Chloroflexota bacterium]